MSRVRVVLTAVCAVLVPSLAAAQVYVVPSCTDPAVVSRSAYGASIPCVHTPPEAAPFVAPSWTRPPVTPVQPLPLIPPPAAVYRAPAPPMRGIDPWIPLAVQPVPRQSTTDLLTQMLLLQQLAAANRARQQQSAVPAPPPAAPAPATGDGWMNGFIKGVK